MKSRYVLGGSTLILRDHYMDGTKSKTRGSTGNRCSKFSERWSLEF